MKAGVKVAGGESVNRWMSCVCRLCVIEGDPSSIGDEVINSKWKMKAHLLGIICNAKLR